TDRGYNRLMKTGRPGSYIPSISTLSRDVHLNFNRARVHIKSRLKGFSGRLNFGAATWSSPNHSALLALTVHYASEGILQSFLLDVVEVAKSQSGTNLAEAFHDVLEDFGISDKVPVSTLFSEVMCSRVIGKIRSLPLRATMFSTTTQCVMLWMLNPPIHSTPCLVPAASRTLLI
ncbi:hypothetical protein BS47DRAFT_1287908, partial [Hydnum rufescens UP504]